MPAKVFPGAAWSPPCAGKMYVKTGAFRPARAGEIILTMTVPLGAYKVKNDVKRAAHIMREATPEESRCSSCGQALPFSQTP